MTAGWLAEMEVAPYIFPLDHPIALPGSVLWLRGWAGSQPGPLQYFLWIIVVVEVPSLGLSVTEIILSY